ncbi:metallophosphoesterase [Liquorilactobacillus hordei]|nr:metallophosphoesterase [Liquorilactobacillus hordei]QYH51147.1 hypothetical protein G6O70_00245 [Liquorilactobacillus hordei DSM 19519]
MRSYINRKGTKVVVTEKHLDTAIKIKEELQKLSPTRRTSWARHKNMMKKEGFLDSDTNEAYRCLIKSEQKERGVLPSVNKHADLLSDNKLQSIKFEIGELNSAKLELQKQGTSVRKLVRDVNKDVLFIEHIEEALKKKDFSKVGVFSKYAPEKYKEQKTMIVCLSDIHYGAVVNLPDNKFNRDICARLLNKYADKVIATIIKENVSSVYVMNLGDLIENVYMRNQNLYNSEETLSEQIVNATELVIKFLDKISAYVKVKYSAIAGNHDRLQGKKDSNLSADHAIRVSNKIIETYAKYSNTQVKFVAAEDYYHSIDVGKYSFCFIHGDLNNLQKKTLLAELSNLHGKHFVAVIGGHIHHFTMLEVGNDQYQVTFGSIKGIDEYSVNIIGAKSSRSQGVVLIGKDGFEIRKIGL